ncbi:DUF4232 domain-containing protein [Streptomyces somaliensis]|uniref:DUF4232 domain-containing protein n=1 Tax=Streptomyces somaliensis TaxID=78355 RepID=UPI0020CCA1E7|nr:DUF4232 domain-containing protein [Streptomyces somaliensis]MCP9946837.1 DUF4232 domain-containing protein [Streptomyces somaliensis]MCP9963473.1 DUF4232 domain-containing protein [Streptomyces somaliensis]MCP9976253.1 DUF4232 domain-containing protein [Streptomyces somaliensis]
MRINKITVAALAAVAGLSLTACQNGGDTANRSGSSAAPAPTPSNGASGAGGSSPGAVEDSPAKNSSGKESNGGRGAATEAGSGKNGGIGRCRTDQLKVTATDRTVEGDSDGTVVVRFTNGGRDCTISGYAGVDLKTSAGPLSAERTGERATPTVLRNGQSVAFGITYPVNDSGGSGVRITGLLVTPPNETKSVSLGWPGAATLPVTDGSGSPVKVGPVGSAGRG